MQKREVERKEEEKYARDPVPFRAGDGFQCNLIHVYDKKRPPEKGPVMLVHGAGVRANLFRAPLKRDIVAFLIDNGYDVWLENWRASIDLRPNHWTLDQAAFYDHPEAVKAVVRKTGWEEVKAIIHCQGSTSFMISAIAGLIPQVKVIVSNAVSLHPIVPFRTYYMAKLLVPLLAMFTAYLNPQWGEWAPGIIPKIITFFVRVYFRVFFWKANNCGNGVCRMANFIYGTGPSVLWSHDPNELSDETHEWLKDEFKWVPLSFFKQMNCCLKKGHLVSVKGIKRYPEDCISGSCPPKTDARFSFIAGELNRVFLPESQEKTFKYFDRHRKNYHTKHILPGFSHLDVFMGEKAESKVFPIILKELDK